MTPTDELRALSHTATGGEWVASNCGVSARGMRSIIATTYVPQSPSSHQYENAAFIAAAANFVRNELPSLLSRLAEVERDAARYAWLREQCGPRGELTIARDNGMNLVAWSGDDPDGKIDAARGKEGL